MVESEQNRAVTDEYLPVDLYYRLLHQTCTLFRFEAKIPRHEILLSFSSIHLTNLVRDK